MQKPVEKEVEVGAYNQVGTLVLANHIFKGSRRTTIEEQEAINKTFLKSVKFKSGRSNRH